MAKRPRNLWRRPYGSFRLGQRKAADVNLDEQRLTLYLPAYILDWAEQQASQSGSPTVQDYCASLLRQQIEEVRNREQASEAEARTSALQSFHDITEDPEYLAEWSASVAPRDPESKLRRNEANVTDAKAEPMSEGPSSAALVVLRHSAAGTEDPSGFLASLRRGEAVTATASAELLQALNALEVEYRDARTIDRRVAYALHRLAFEGQILHTDAWPGSIDAETVHLLRVVQEAVDRVLSGEDIRYYPSSS